MHASVLTGCLISPWSLGSHDVPAATIMLILLVADECCEHRQFRTYGLGFSTVSLRQ